LCYQARALLQRLRQFSSRFPEPEETQRHPLSARDEGRSRAGIVEDAWLDLEGRISGLQLEQASGAGGGDDEMGQSADQQVRLASKSFL
jgi:hypothetical protein